MTSISSVNNAALLILQQASTVTGSGQEKSDATDLVKVANGISAEPSDGAKSAAAIAGKFAVDTAPASGKIVVEGLGSADSWEEMKDLVNNNESMSATEKNEWLSKLKEMEGLEASVRAFKASELYTSATSGPIAEQAKAFSEEAAAASQRNAATIDSMNDLLVSQGRDKLRMTA